MCFQTGGHAYAHIQEAGQRSWDPIQRIAGTQGLLESFSICVFVCLHLCICVFVSLHLCICVFAFVYLACMSVSTQWPNTISDQFYHHVTRHRSLHSCSNVMSLSKTRRRKREMIVILTRNKIFALWRNSRGWDKNSSDKVLFTLPLCQCQCPNPV